MKKIIESLLLSIFAAVIIGGGWKWAGTGEVERDIVLLMAVVYFGLMARGSDS